MRAAAAQGKLREIELRHRLGQMSLKEAVAALETLTTVWRGDETEAEGLRLLAHLYTKEARYREAFHVMRVALLAHPNSDLTRKIQDEAAATFESLFLSHKGDTLPPIEALGLFYDYRELTPIGRRGDEMIRRLADRLVAVDLLDQAAKLLQHQVDHRLQGAARAQVATRLAVIYLMDHKPDRALASLRSTRTAQLNDELRDQRLLLQARALSDLGRYDLALEVIQDIKSHQAMRLRADILWAAQRWRKAAEQIELLYGDRWRDFRPLNASERFDILRAAIGYALADEPLGLQRFREKYAAKMERGPDGHAFDVVSAPIGTTNAEFRAVATHVASLDTLDAFLSDMRKRYPDSNAISAQGRGRQEGQRRRKLVRPKRGERCGQDAGAEAVAARHGDAQECGAQCRCARRRRPSAPPSMRRASRQRRAAGAAEGAARRAAGAGPSRPGRFRGGEAHCACPLTPVALDQRACHQAPAVHQHEEDQLERQRHHHRRQHHHAHRHQHRGHHQVDDQERQEQQEADLEGALEFGDHEGRHQHAQRQVLRVLRHRLLRHVDEQLEVLRR